ncbi:MAG: hypothetical protein ABJA70_02715 [Chryseolinea sp.]
MKVFIVIVVTLFAVIDPIKIGKVNSAKSEARKAYNSGDYKLAVNKYRYLSDSLNVTEDEVMLNLANSYFQTNDTTNASATYQSLTGSVKPEIRSKAQQQLGILNHRQGKLEEALQSFKQAIKSDADNKDARYNYEMLKKKLDEEKKKQQQQDQQNKEKENKDNKKDQKDQKKDDQKKDQEKKDQQKKDQEKKDQQKKDQEQKDQQKDQEKDKQDKDKNEKKDAEQEKKENKDKQNSQQLSDKLQQMKISEDKAKMILEAMKNQEIQYLQQNKRKATKPKDKSKPDW